MEDPDLDVDRHELLSFSLDDAPSNMNVGADTGVIQWIPTNDQASQEYTVVVNVTDGEAFDTQSFTITVANVNDPPAILSVSPATEVLENETYSELFEAVDYDPTRDELEWNLASNASWLGMDPATGELIGTPGQEDVGSYWANVTVSDGNGGADFLNFTVTVLALPEPEPEQVELEIGPFLDEDDEPVEGAEVTVKYNGEEYTGTTDEDGNVLIEIPGEEWTGEEADVEVIVEINGQEVEFAGRLTAGGSFSTEDELVIPDEEDGGDGVTDGGDGGTSGDGSGSTFVVIAIVAVIAVAAVVALLFFRGRMQKPEEKEEAEVEPPED